MNINKCSFCPYSHNKEGVLVCRYSYCQYNKDNLIEMMKLIFNGNSKEQEY